MRSCVGVHVLFLRFHMLNTVKQNLLSNAFFLKQIPYSILVHWVLFSFIFPNDICVQVTGMHLFSIKNRMSVINKE